MKRFHPYLFIALSLICLSAETVQETRLSYNLKSGETYALQIDLQQTTRSEAMDRDEISLYSLTNLELKVDSIDMINQFHMTVRYKDLLISMLAPGMNIDINSDSGKDTLLSAMVDALENEEFHIVMDNTGELRLLDGLDHIFKSLSSFPVSDTNQHRVILKTLEEVYGPDSFKSQYSLFVTVYPVLETMTNWTNDILYYFNTKPVWILNRYSLARHTENTLIIQGMGMLNTTKEFEEKTSMGEVRSTVSGSQTYDFQMDPESGWIKKCVSRQRTLIETTIVKSSYLPTGLKIPSYTETVFEVKGSRIQ
jgi:hypothetical protein